ncbi:N-acetyltransferase family protein [Capilliphycus salinus ALCB114379]|uniref:GNAT family N-acetyltransferase n=1 Tax=Capilliphycus salinus TaxID=2768948 RepID=UPI0039A4676D
MNPIIRISKPSDIFQLTEIYNHYVLNTAITFDVKLFTVERRTEEWFRHYSHQGRYRLFVAELDGQVLGYATSSCFRPKAAYETSVETSVYVHPKATRKGIGTRLYSVLFKALKKEDVHRAYAGITLPNPASIALHKKFGFQSVGVYREVGRKFYRYWDVEWFEKSLS